MLRTQASRSSVALSLKVLLAAVVVLTVWARCAPAQALVPQSIQDNAAQVEAFVESGGIPARRDREPCAGVCALLRGAEPARPANPTAGRLVLDELYKLRQALKLTPPYDLLPSIAVGGLATADFLLVKHDVSLLLRVDGPFEAPGVSYARVVSAGQQLSGRGSGSTLQNVINAPESGVQGYDVNDIAVHWSTHSRDCNQYPSDVAPATGAYHVLTASGPCIFPRPGSWSDSVLFKPAEVHTTVPTGPVDPAVPRVEWPPFNVWYAADNDAASVTQKMLNELLEHPETYGALTPWLDHHLGGPAPDPTTSPLTVPSCRGLLPATCDAMLADAGFTDVRHLVLKDWATQEDIPAGTVADVEDEGQPHGANDELGVAEDPDVRVDPIPPMPRTTDEDDSCDIAPGGRHQPPDNSNGIFTPVLGTDPTSMTSPANFQIARGGSAAVVAGWAREEPDGDWAGFGFDKVYAKHGWSLADSREVAFTLSSFNTVEGQEGSRTTYTSKAQPGDWHWLPTRSGKRLCVRRVVVQPARIGQSDGGLVKPFELQPPDQVQTGIWTTFGMAVTRPR